MNVTMARPPAFPYATTSCGTSVGAAARSGHEACACPYGATGIPGCVDTEGW